MFIATRKSGSLATGLAGVALALASLLIAAFGLVPEPEMTLSWERLDRIAVGLGLLLLGYSNGIDRGLKGGEA